MEKTVLINQPCRRHAILKSSFLTLSYLLEIFKNKHAAIIHGKNAPGCVQPQQLPSGDPIVLTLKKMCECGVCSVCVHKQYIWGNKEGYINRKEWEVGPGKKNGGKAVRNVWLFLKLQASPGSPEVCVETRFCLNPRIPEADILGVNRTLYLFIYFLHLEYYIVNKSLKTTALRGASF